MGAMELVVLLAIIVVGALVGGGIGFYIGRKQAIAMASEMRTKAESDAESIVKDARAEAQEIRLEAKEEAVQRRDEIESELQERRQDLQNQEKHLQRRRDTLDRRQEQLENRNRNLEQRAKRVEQREQEIDELVQKQKEEIERIAEMTREEARDELLQSVEQEARKDMARVMREVETEAQETANRRAREIILTAVQRLATDVANDSVVSMVPLPSDDMKGRIIGRGGRNIRAIENATGVDVVVDDTPEAVVVSSFDPVRREIARLALEKLVADGRIHPARVEEVVSETRDEVDEIIREAGEEAAYEAGVRGLHPEIIRLLGQLKFRTSYGQNQWQHAIEAAHLAGLLAAEVGADPDLAKRGALLHDIGKAVTHEVEGPHALIGAEIARRCGVNPTVVNSIASHHHEEEQESLEAIIVEVADAISGARPGARRESLENYIKRIKALEDVARGFDGVEEVYALQAGREIRIIVKPDEIDDLKSIRMSKNIARKVEEGLEYPGQIKVTVIRETRAVDYAK